MSADPLLQPFRLKTLTIRNRLMSTAHEPAYTHDGMPKDRYRAYHVEKAKGGIGLTMIGGSAVVAPDSPQAFGNILLYKDEVIGWLKALADDVHAQGAAVMIQITHLGRRTSWAKDDWLPVLAPSHVREPAHRAFPKAMEEFDISRVVAAYADAAERVQAAGLDGLEVEAYGHLVDQFWSPLTNHRADEYGGSLENRMRFGIEVLRAIRDRVGEDFIVGVRAVADEDVERGIGKTEGLAIAQTLAASGLIDFFNVIRGHIDTEEGLSRVIPGMGERSAPHLDFAGEVRAATRLPTFHAARVQDVATARHAIESGKLDLVGMTRAHLADPHIVLKIKQGREHEIRPCVGMGYCIDSIYSGNAVCIHNAATGRELTMPHVVTRTDGRLKTFVIVGAGPGGLEAARVAAARGHRTILMEAAAAPGGRELTMPHVVTRTDGRLKTFVIVGAGPGGLEAARVAAARGHKTILMEAAAAPGGQVRVAAGLTRRREIMGIVDWRLAQCEKHGVELRTNLYAEAEDVIAEGPDVVIVATGGVPNLDFLRHGAEHATSSWDILTGAVKPAANVLVYDDNGAHPGVSVAEFCARAGANVDYMTPERMLGPDVGSTSFPPYLRAFSQYDVGVTLNLRLESIRREGNRLVGVFHDEYGAKRVERIAEQIVVDHGATPVDELYFALKPGSRNLGEVDQAALLAVRAQTLIRNAEGAYQLFRIGDAVASRNIHAAIYDALRLVSVM